MQQHPVAMQRTHSCLGQRLRMTQDVFKVLTHSDWTNAPRSALPSTCCEASVAQGQKKRTHYSFINIESDWFDFMDLARLCMSHAYSD